MQAHLSHGKDGSLRGPFLIGILFLLGAGSLFAQAPAKRPLTADDVYRMKEVGDPRVSPDGRWIAYTVTSVDREADKLRTDIWMVNWEGTQDLQVTNGPDSEASPRWSPDGKYLAFLSARPAEAKSQIWLLDRRGGEFTRSILADRGNKGVADVLAGVDHAVRMAIADPDRLGIGDWSYEGILTDYTIATDTRFKAAISGAGSALQLSMYGGDQYVRQYEQEIGLPWKAVAAWVRLSYPFFRADRIKTPTVFIGGEKDFNVPILGSEQMYQALRSLGTPTQLVIYPGQYHLLTRPSYIRERLERYLAWFDKYVKSPK
jgi:dipeptidyl aminopeptidase/acylaminoacyl peptidase